MTGVNRGLAPSNDHGDLVGDGRDLPATWAEVGRDNVASWRASGLDGDRTYFYGTFPASASAIINLGEVVVHGWDLATAMAQPFAGDPELATLVYGLYSVVPLDEQATRLHHARVGADRGDRRNGSRDRRQRLAAHRLFDLM